MKKIVKVVAISADEILRFANDTARTSGQSEEEILYNISHAKEKDKTIFTKDLLQKAVDIQKALNESEEESNKMEATKFLKEFHRMCTSYCNCDGCPALKEDISCVLTDPESVEHIVQCVEKWSKEHPKKTLLDDLKEKYPNVMIGKYGFPSFCPYKLGYEQFSSKRLNHYCSKLACKECWNRPLDEVVESNEK